MGQTKIPHSFKFSKQVTAALERLAELPAYGNKTRVLESLVWREAEALHIIKNNMVRRDGNSKKPL